MKLETINVGRIVNAHGIRGEVRVQPRDGDPAFLTQFKTFLLNGQPVTPTANHVHKSVVDVYKRQAEYGAPAPLLTFTA